MSKILLILLTVATIAVLVYGPVQNFLQNNKSTPKPVTLTFWGVKETPKVLQKAISKYKQSHPYVTINFVDQSLQNYRTRVETQILQNTGPDIFVIHNNWLPMFLQSKVLAEVPQKVMSTQQFTQSFYPVAQTLINNGRIYALPAEIDGLALFYNQDILKATNLAVPRTW